MMYRDIIAVCSEIHTKHTNALRGQNVEFLNVMPGVQIVTTRSYAIKTNRHSSVKKTCFLFSNDNMFRSKRPTSDHNYQNFKTRYNTEQIML